MKVEVLFPEVCNLYGDLMNVDYLEKSGAESVNTSLKERPKFIDGGIDLVFMGAMTEKSQEIVIKALAPFRDDIKKAVNAGQAFLATGNAFEIFGKEIQNEDGTAIPCLGIFDTVAKRRMFDRYNAIYLGKFDGFYVVGFKSQFSHSYGGDNYGGIFRNERGDGRYPGFEEEGIRVNNFFGTYLLGPLLPLNPPFTKYLMKLCGVENPHLAFEEKAMEVYEKRVKEFKDPSVRVKY